jgi:pimeloyl-ACP methyl ester carboxylesterase
LGSDHHCFVLVHGAWHGGWCWRDVRRRLEAAGHLVFTPTQTGLGERSHLVSGTIDLDVFVQDVVNVLRFERLEDVVLVGHSFGGNAISGAAQRMPEAVRKLVYLDALLIETGETPFSRSLPENVAARLAAAEATSGGLTVPAPPAEAFGVIDKEQAAWVDALLTPHPLRTYQSTLDLGGDITNGRPAAYIVCTDPLYANLASSRDRARSKGWPLLELATGHDAMVSAPLETADLLMRLAGQG